MSVRSRQRILANLETIYREAYARAKSQGDENRMIELDWAYQREQLILEVLLDVRDALAKPDDKTAPKKTLEKLQELRRLTRRT